MFKTRSLLSLETSLSFAVSGDGITARPGSWRDQLRDRRLRPSGGFAEEGATSERAFGQVRRSLADVLVVMIGMEDVKASLPFSEMTSNIEKIVRFAECTAPLICLVPPTGRIDQRARGVSANRHLADLGARRGWLVADPFAFVRAADNSWGGSSSDDGVHPTSEVSVEAAERMRLFIRQAAAVQGLNR